MSDNNTDGTERNELEEVIHQLRNHPQRTRMDREQRRLLWEWSDKLKRYDETDTERTEGDQ